MNWQKRINDAIKTRKNANELRIRTAVEHGSGPILIYENQSYRNFSSNDYLGLSQHPAVIRAWQKGAWKFGVGSGGSGHINGYTTVHKQLEEILAQWLGYSSALLFTSGFAANQAVITALTSKNDRIIADRLSHASILEAANLSAAQLKRFRHNDIKNLNLLLNNDCIGQQLVITEGIFSMDGDSAPLTSIHDIVKRNNAWLMVDDAHGIGVIGHDGKGSCDVQKVKPEILIITFGKSIGISGAAVLCNSEVAQYLLQFARHLIYSTSMPPAQVMALQVAVKIVQSDDGERRRHRLTQYIHTFRNGVGHLKAKFLPSDSAIQSLLVGDNIYALHLAQRLRNTGIWTIAVRPPTVPVGTSRLRFTLTAAHKQQDIIVLLETLNDICR